jgi:hypothetical protein
MEEIILGGEGSPRRRARTIEGGGHGAGDPMIPMPLLESAGGGDGPLGAQRSPSYRQRSNVWGDSQSQPSQLYFRRVTVANMRERQEALAAAHTHGKKIFVTGGDHVTLNDMLIAAKLNQRKVEATGRERDKKSWVEYHARREAALPIVDRLENELENNVGRLKSKELEVLLRWKGVLVSTMGNVANRRILYQQFTEGRAEEVGIVPAPWTEIDEAELIALRDGPIAICNTVYGRFEEQKKRDVERAYQKMTAAEKEVFKRKMAK